MARIVSTSDSGMTDNFFVHNTGFTEIILENGIMMVYKPDSRFVPENDWGN